jgi:hypothetical protein
MIQLHNPTTLLPMTPAERVRWCAAEMRRLEADMAEAGSYAEWMPLARALILVRREHHDAWLMEAACRAVSRFHSSECAA